MKNVLFLCTNFHNFDHLYLSIAQKLNKNFNLFALFDKYSTYQSYKQKFNSNEVKTAFVFEQKITKTCEFKPSRSLFYYYQVDYDRVTYFDFKPQITADFLEKIGGLIATYLVDNKIDYVVSEGPYNIFCRITHEIANNLGLKVFSLKGGRLYSTSFVANHDGITPAFCNLNKTLEIKSEKVEYISKMSHLQRGFFAKLFRFKDTSFFNVFLRELPFIFNRYDKLHPTYPNALLFQLILLYEQIKRNFRREYGCCISDVKKAKLESERIILYPEHFHPEASYSATNFELRNDFENILNIASNLPSDCKLVVKLHPSNAGRVSTSLYRNIENSTGVIFLRSDQSLDELLSFTNLIVSVNSTVVIDAAKRGVPSILIGEMEVTEGCVGVKRITCFSEIKSVLNDQVIANAYLNEDWFASHYLDVYLWSEDFADRFHAAICDETKHVAQI